MTDRTTKPERQAIRARVEGIDGAYVLTSASRREDDSYTNGLRAAHSYFYDGGDVAAEWEPNYGPIQLWQRAAEAGADTRPHYFYPHVLDRPLDWSQLAVEEEGLPAALVRGDVAHIFAVLRRWARRHVESAS